MKEKISTLAIIGAGALLRIFLITRDSVPFAFDMGRDLLWAKDIAFYYIPTLIGPAASIWGVYFGPLWFYFLSAPLLLTNGNPLSAAYATSFVILLTSFLGFFLFKRTLKSYAVVLSLIIAYSGGLISISTFAFHANVLPLLTILMIYFCYQARVLSPLFLAAAFSMSSLMFHADPAPAVAFSFVPLFTFFYFGLYKIKERFKVITFSVVAFILPFLPQVLFEVRNNFIEVKALSAYFRGENPSLSGQLPFFERILNRIVIYFDLLKTSFGGENTLYALILLSFTIFGILKYFKNNKNKNLRVLFKINFYAFAVTFLIFTIPITVEVKNWYLHGVLIIFSIFIIFALLGLKKYKLVLPLFIIVYLVFNIKPFFSKERIVNAQKDPALVSNQLAAIDVIYTDAKNAPYSVFIFTPSIYDLNYQYLYWWQGVRLKRGLPDDFSYLPDKPEYVRNKSNYQVSAHKTQTVYLIIEQGRENEFYTKDNWLKNFNEYNLVWEKDINEAVKIQKRQK